MTVEPRGDIPFPTEVPISAKIKKALMNGAAKKATKKISPRRQAETISISDGEESEGLLDKYVAFDLAKNAFLNVLLNYLLFLCEDEEEEECSIFFGPDTRMLGTGYTKLRSAMKLGMKRATYRSEERLPTGTLGPIKVRAVLLLRYLLQ